MAIRFAVAAAVLLAAVTLLPAEPATAQGTLVRARMALALPSRATPIPVTLEYQLRPDPGAREVGFTLLTPGTTRIAAIRAMVAGGRVPLELTEVRPHYWKGTLEIPSRQDSGPASSDPASAPEFTLLLSYMVEGSQEEEGRVTIPILAPEWPPSDPHPRTFLAGVQVPPGLTVAESFPTSVVARPRGAEGGPYDMALQGVPAMMVLRVVQGEPPFFGLERVLDLFVVTLLLVMAFFGARYLKGRGG